MIDMSTDIVNVNTKWLKWARTSVKYEKDVVANKLNINPEKNTEWEETGTLTSNELVALSEIYQVSPYTFFDGNDPVYDKRYLILGFLFAGDGLIFQPPYYQFVI